MRRRRVRRSLVAGAVLLAATSLFSAPLATGASSDSGSLPPVPDGPQNEPPPEALELLGRGLLGTGDLGLPDSWTLIDIDPALADDPDFAEQFAILDSLVTCPTGVFRDPTVAWIARQFDGVGGPLDDGLLFFETMLVAETPEAASADRAAVAACTAQPSVTLTARTGTLPVAEFLPDGSTSTEPPVELDFAALDLESPPTDDRPYPVAATVVWSHRDGVTVVATALSASTAPVDNRPPAALPAEWLATSVLARFGVSTG